MRKKFDILGLIFSVILAGVGIGAVMACFPYHLRESAPVAIATTGLLLMVPLLTGYDGLRLSLRLRRKKFRAPDSKAAARRVIVVALIAGLLGAGGQVLYGLEWETYTEETVVDTSTKGRHIVLLMDISGSMKEEKPACIEAACRLIDGMDDTTTMQVIAFAASVTDRCTSQYLPLTPENKTTLQNMIRSVDMGGGTNFNQPLDMAIQTLKGSADPEYRSMILMLTDGKEAVNDTIRGTLTDPASGIELFTVRIGTDASDHNVRDLIDLAVQDFPIAQQTDGTVDITDVLDTLEKAANYQTVVQEEHRRLIMGGDQLLECFIANKNVEFWWRPVLQVVVMAVYAVLVSFAYYGRLGKGSLALSLAAGLATGLALALNQYVASPMMCVLCLGGFTVYEVQEVEAHV